MEVLHLASPQNLTADEYFNSPSFLNLGINSSYTFNIEKLNTNIELNAGIKNILDDYQNDFDKGKDRDSNFIFGPATPRTFTFGIKFTSN